MYTHITIRIAPFVFTQTWNAFLDFYVRRSVRGIRNINMLIVVWICVRCVAK